MNQGESFRCVMLQVPQTTCASKTMQSTDCMHCCCQNHILLCLACWQGSARKTLWDNRTFLPPKHYCSSFLRVFRCRCVTLLSEETVP